MNVIQSSLFICIILTLTMDLTFGQRCSSTSQSDCESVTECRWDSTGICVSEACDTDCAECSNRFCEVSLSNCYLEESGSEICLESTITTTEYTDNDPTPSPTQKPKFVPYTTDDYMTSDSTGSGSISDSSDDSISSVSSNSNDDTSSNLISDDNTGSNDGIDDNSNDDTSSDSISDDVDDVDEESDESKDDMDTESVSSESLSGSESESDDGTQSQSDEDERGSRANVQGFYGEGYKENEVVDKGSDSTRIVSLTVVGITCLSILISLVIGGWCFYRKKAMKTEHLAVNDFEVDDDDDDDDDDDELDETEFVVMVEKDVNTGN